MINILLICSAGMSTSMMVRKMNDTAKAKGMEVNIWAVGESEAESNMQKADVILLGPQIRFMKKKIQEQAPDKPVAIIDMGDYGTMNGEKVLMSAINLVSK